MEFSNKLKKSKFDRKKKTSELVKNKMGVDNSSFVFYPHILKWDFFEFGKIRELKHLPEKNCAYRILCNRNINSIEVLGAFKTIDSISCSFATLNEHAVEELNKHKVIDMWGRVDPSNPNLFRNPLFDQVKSINKHKITGHMKIMLIESEGQFFTVNTSANPKGSSQFECYTVYNSEKVYYKIYDALNCISKKEIHNIKPRIEINQMTMINRHGDTPVDLIKEILIAEQIEQIDIIAFSLGVKALSVFDIFDQSVKINFHVSDFVLKMKSQVKPLDKIKEILTKNNGKIDVYNTHTKITLIKTKSNYYIIDSTSNLDSNSKYEITELRNSKEEYTFTINFIKKHFK